ncbi:MAG: hypothetical protein KDJ45_16375 [Hyphomicrobiaceae bacterium]|nr:hypothetical protein [Hyphomicrobiaceae bacterium]
MLQHKCKFFGALVASFALFAASSVAEAKGSCVVKTAEGTGVSKKSAQFQVDEALLQAVDWGAWAAWMASGTTPGYKFGKRKYSCKAGGLGFNCRGTARICKI